jgi:hypothetical protein
MTEYKNFEFSPDGLTKILGGYLVTDPVIPIFEMVKNSWDGCAKKVDIEIFRNHITVKDDGTGFPDEKMRRWLTVGDMNENNYESKCIWRDNPRTRTGIFDIGHMVPFSLGNRLTLVTCSSDHKCSRVNINFIELQNGQSKIEIENFTDNGRSAGTEIGISELNPSITIDEKFTEKVNRVMRTFRNVGEDFSVSVKGPNDSDPHVYDTKFHGPSTKKSGEKINFKFEVGQNGTIFNVMREDRSGDDELNELISREIENTKDKFSQSISQVEITSLLKNVKITGRIYSKDLPEWEYGVFIYRDGVRVMPYGSKYGEDWLGLDTERAERGGSNYPRNKNIFCMIRISRNGNPDLMDAVDREGLIKNTAFYLLYAVTRAVLVRTNGMIKGKQHRIRNPPIGGDHQEYRPSDELKMLKWLIKKMKMERQVKTKVIGAIDAAIADVEAGRHLLNAYSDLIDLFNRSILMIRGSILMIRELQSNNLEIPKPTDREIPKPTESDVVNRVAKYLSYRGKISGHVTEAGKRDIDCLFKDSLRLSRDLGNIARHVSNLDFGNEDTGFCFLDRPEGFMASVLIMASVIQLLNEGELIDSSQTGIKCGDVRPYYTEGK